jgi:hypothetical protein
MGCRVAFGTCGSGKSYGLKADARAIVKGGFFPLLVLDSTGEWTLEAPKGSVVVPNVETAERALGDGVPLAVVLVDGEDDDERMAQVESAFRWVVTRKPRKTEDEGGIARAGVLVNEAQMIWPNGCRLSRNVYKAIAQWRHSHSWVGLDVQKPSALNTTMTDLARETRAYAVGGFHDLERLRAIGGKPLLEANAEAMRRFQAGGGVGGTGAGWHVTLDEGKLPDASGRYEVTR